MTSRKRKLSTSDALGDAPAASKKAKTTHSAWVELASQGRVVASLRHTVSTPTNTYIAKDLKGAVGVDWIDFPPVCVVVPLPDQLFSATFVTDAGSDRVDFPAMGKPPNKLNTASAWSKTHGFYCRIVYHPAQSLLKMRIDPEMNIHKEADGKEAKSASAAGAGSGTGKEEKTATDDSAADVDHVKKGWADACLDDTHVFVAVGRTDPDQHYIKKPVVAADACGVTTAVYKAAADAKIEVAAGAPIGIYVNRTSSFHGMPVDETVDGVSLGSAPLARDFDNAATVIQKRKSLESGVQFEVAWGLSAKRNKVVLHEVRLVLPAGLAFKRRETAGAGSGSGAAGKEEKKETEQVLIRISGDYPLGDMFLVPNDADAMKVISLYKRQADPKASPVTDAEFAFLATTEASWRSRGLKQPIDRDLDLRNKNVVAFYPLIDDV